MPEAVAKNGRAAEWGERIEEWAAETFGLELVDGTHVDARTESGDAVQIKACQRWVSNGADGERARGRWTVWSETLLYLLGEGEYLLVLYDPDDDADPVESFRWIDPETVGEHVGDSWGSAHRPTKGKRARLRWNELIPTEAVTA